MFLTRAFEAYYRFVIGAGIVLCATLWYRRWSGDPIVEVGRSEMIVLAAMVIVAGLIIAVLHPQAAALQAHAFSMKDEAAKKTALEELFRVLFPLRALSMLNLFLGIMLIGIKAKRSLDQAGRYQ